MSEANTKDMVIKERPQKTGPDQVIAPNVRIPKKVPDRIVTEKPTRKGMRIGTKVALWTMGGLMAVEGAGVFIKEETNHVPPTAQTIKADLAWPLDITKSIAAFFRNKPNIETTVTPTSMERTPLVLGQNAAYATPTQMQEFLQSPLPTQKPASEIKTPADLPQIGVIADIDLSKSGILKWYTTGPILIGGPLEGQRVPEVLCIDIPNKDTSFGFIAPEGGINTDSFELFLRKPDIVNGQPEYNCYYEKFNLGNGRYKVMEIENDFLPSEFLKDAPIIDPVQINKEGINNFQAIGNQQGKKISIADCPRFASTKNENSTIYATLIDSGYDVLPILHLQDNNGTILFSAPN